MQYIIICLISLFLYSPALADTLQGRVVKIADGDTVTIVDDSGQKHRIRLMGIDAPEKDQSHGDVSTKNLERPINGKRTTINFSKHDWYGRIVGKVLVDPPSSVNKAPSDNKYLKQGRGYFSVSGFAVSWEIYIMIYQKFWVILLMSAEELEWSFMKTLVLRMMMLLAINL